MERLGLLIVLLISIGCIYLVHQYAHRETCGYVKTTHGYDATVRYNIELLWTVLYWGSFTFSWIILPFFMFYETCGEFTIATKIKRALLENLYYYLYFAVAALPLLAFCYSMGMLSSLNFADLAVAASNSIGIFLCIVCMGYSIPFIPARLLKAPPPQEQLKKLQYEISLSKQLLNTMKVNMMSLVASLTAFESHPDLQPQHQKHIEKIREVIPRQFYEKALGHISSSNTEVAVQKPTEGALINLHKSVKTLREEVSRLKMKQHVLSKKAVYLEEVIESGYLDHGRLHGIHSPNRKGFSDIASFKVQLLCSLSVWPFFSKILGVITTILSVILVLVEVLGLCNKQVDDFFKEFITSRGNWFVNLVGLCIFGYAIFCVHFAVFRFKFTGFYNLYYGKQTDTASLLYSGL